MKYKEKKKQIIQKNLKLGTGGTKTPGMTCRMINRQSEKEKRETH